MSQWGDILGTAQGLVMGPGGIVNNSVYGGQMVANPSDLTNQYWNQAGGMAANAPNMAPFQQAMTSAGADLYNTQHNPSNINLPGITRRCFQPGQLNLPSSAQRPTSPAPTARAALPRAIWSTRGRCRHRVPTRRNRCRP